MVYFDNAWRIYQKVPTIKWNDLITSDDEFKANILRLMDEEIVQKFDRREGDAQDFYADPEDLTVPLKN